MTTPGAASRWLALFHLPLGHVLKPVHVIGIGPLTVIACGNLWCGNNVNNDVLASDEMIFIGHTSSCA